MVSHALAHHPARPAARFHPALSADPRLQAPRLLQTGTGKAHTTAISAAISTTVIFSLVDKSMASLRARCQPQRRAVRGLSCLHCDGDHAPTGCLSVSITAPACRL
jgi:hypothetical protein